MPDARSIFRERIETSDCFIPLLHLDLQEKSKFSLPLSLSLQEKSKFSLLSSLVLSISFSFSSLLSSLLSPLFSLSLASLLSSSSSLLSSLFSLLSSLFCFLSLLSLCLFPSLCFNPPSNWIGATIPRRSSSEGIVVWHQQQILLSSDRNIHTHSSIEQSG